jgi:DNA invertase Pin-like site-specific DNA recombinase
MPMSKRAAAYLRRSTDRQEQSIGDQRAAIERYAAEHGFAVVREYVDDAISGADTAARKAFLQMINDATRRGTPFQYVLVYDVSRFGRTGADEAGFFRHTLTQAGIEVIYVAEALTGTDADDLLLATKQWLAHRMVVDLSKVTIRGQLSRVGKGRWCGGRPPYGYDLVYFDSLDRPYQTIRFLDSGDREVRLLDGTVQRIIPRGDPLPVTSSDRANLLPGDPTKVAVVRRIFDLYVNKGLGLATIAERLNDDGITSAMGHRPGTRWNGTWSSGTIRAFLRNPAYRGATAWNRISYAKFHVVKNGQAVPRSKVSFGRVRRNDEADWVIVEGTHEPIVPPTVFERARRLIRVRASAYERMNGPIRKDSPYALSGLMRCDRCGARWQGYRLTKGRKRPDAKQVETLYYCCGSYVTKGNAVCQRALVKKEAIESVVVESVRKHLDEIVATRGARISGITVEAAGSGEPRHLTEQEIRTGIMDRREKLNGLIDSLTPALKGIVAPKILDLRGEIAGLESELDGRLRVGTPKDQAKARAASIVAWAGRAVALLSIPIAAMDTRTTRGVLRAVVKEIVLDPERMACRITFQAIPDLENDPTIAA